MTWESPSKARKTQPKIKITRIIFKKTFPPQCNYALGEKIIRPFGHCWRVALNWHWFQMTRNIIVVHQSRILWNSGDQWYFSLHPFHSEPHWVSQTILWLFLQFQNVQWGYRYLAGSRIHTLVPWSVEWGLLCEGQADSTSSTSS